MSIFDVSVPVQAGEQGLARITKFEISEEDSRRTALRAAAGHPGAYVRPGSYTKLHVGGQLMMSDTTMERRTNHAFVCHAHGRVLVAGLGIGLILEAVLAKPEVETVTVIEKYQDVVYLVAPHYLDRYADKLTVITTDNLKDMGRLHRAFGRHLDKTDDAAWMDSWMRHDLKARQRAERRSGW